MTTSIRYGAYTNAQAVATEDAIQRMEIAPEYVKVTLPVIAAGANANVWTTKSPGTIKAIMGCRITKAGGADLWADSQAHTPNITITADGKSVNIACTGGGTATEATDLAYLTLAVGY
jgi:hypothetical protein